MSSQARSSSGVRDLRAMFENKQEPSNDSSSDRGRSPGGASQSRSPSARKIRSNFVNVDSGGYMAPNNTHMDGMSERRESFSVANKNDKNAIQDAQASVIDELKKRQSTADTAEIVPEQAVGTAGMPLPNRIEQSEHPDKRISAVEDESAALNPGDAKSKRAVSGGAALKKQLSTTSEKAASNAGANATKAKPPNLSTGSHASHGTTKQTSSKTSPKTPTETSKSRQATAGQINRPSRVSASSSTTSPGSKARSPTRPVNLPSHLTQPTASSAAKHELDKRQSNRAQAKDGPRSTTKPVALPSRLMAGTASSNAKHEEKHEEPHPLAKSTSSTRTSLVGLGPTSRNFPTSSTSLKRQSDTMRKEPVHSEKKTPAAPSESFLARMMKPTTASSNRAAPEHEKPEHKVPAPQRSIKGVDPPMHVSNKAKALDGPAREITPRSSFEEKNQKAEEQALDNAEESKGSATDVLTPAKNYEKARREVGVKEHDETKFMESSEKEQETSALMTSSNPVEEVTSLTKHENTSDAGSTKAPPEVSTTPSSDVPTDPIAQEHALPSEKTMPYSRASSNLANNKNASVEPEATTPIALTETKANEKSNVPAATTTNAAMSNPEIEDQLKPLPMTTGKSEEMLAGKQNKTTTELQASQAIEKADIDPKVSPASRAEAKYQTIEQQEDHSERQTPMEISNGDKVASSEKDKTPPPNETNESLEETPNFRQKMTEELIR